MHRHLQITLALLILAILPSRAATYYVRTDGNDANTGTANTSGGAWRTIQKAANTVVAGDTVNIMNGTYAENVNETTSGSSGNPITYTGSSGAIIRRFTFTGNFITLSGVSIGEAGSSSSGCILNGNNNTISGVFFNMQRINGVGAIEITGDNNTVTGCDITGTFNCPSITTQSSAADNLVKDTLFHALSDSDPLWIWGTRNIFRNLEVTGSVNPGYSSIPWHTDVFQTFGENGDTMIDCVIENCYFHDNNGQLANLERNYSDNRTDTPHGPNTNMQTLIIRNNLFKNIENTCFTGLKAVFYNNVFDNVGSSSNSAGAIRLQAGGDGNVNDPTGSEVRNNVFITKDIGTYPTSLSLGSFLITNNYFGTTTFGPLGTSGTNAVNGGNPQWVNRAAGNYQISSATSALVNVGANLTSSFTTDRAGATRPSSGSWEIGPYEFGASTTTADIPSFSPAAGPYFGTQSVVLASPGATVRYTTNGTTPTSSNGSVYSTPITVSTGTTIKAYALASGMTDSAVVSADYEVGSWVSANTWKTFQVSPQIGTYTWSFRAVPSALGADIVIGMSPVPAAAYANLAASIRFNDTNTIDVMNAGAYNSVTTVPYVAGGTYDFVATINVATNLYSVTVSSGGGAPVTIASNYGFRNSQTSLSYVGMFSDTAPTATVSQMSFGTTDTTAPTPNPATFSSLPTPVDSFRVTMTATLATDAQSPTVEYFFQETTGHAGATSSGWQSSNTFVDSGLSPNTLYSYYVWTRDGNSNQGSPSATMSATTLPAVTGGTVNCNTLNVTTLRIGP